jgi:hypothetical protein
MNERLYHKRDALIFRLLVYLATFQHHLCNYGVYICKTQIRVHPSNPCPIITLYSDPCPSKALSLQICVLWCHTQIYVLSKTYLLRSVSSDVILRSMSSKIYVPSDLCPLTSYSDLCPPKYMFPQICVLWHNTQIKVIYQKKYPHRSVSSTFWTERKKTFIAINSRIHIWDTHWLVPVWYQLISCIIYPFILCVVFSRVFSCNLWSYCSMYDSVHKTKNRPLDLFYTWLH